MLYEVITKGLALLEKGYTFLGTNTDAVIVAYEASSVSDPGNKEKQEIPYAGSSTDFGKKITETVIKGVKARITSYNVCYTKLLRGARQSREALALARGPDQGRPAPGRGHRRCPARAGPRRRSDRRPAGRGGVITSYSIHYTKLYEIPNAIVGWLPRSCGQRR